MFGAAFAWTLIIAFRKSKTTANGLFPFAMLQITNNSLASTSNLNLFLIFLKIGSILYGSGYVLFAFLDSELVTKGILSRQQLIDAIAVGQFTPGPVFSSVTFVGYQINNITGAVVSTIGIFLPSFIFVAFLNPFVKRMRSSELFSAFLDAINVASIAVILVVCIHLGKDAIVDWRTILIAVSCFVLLYSFRKLNSVFIIIGGSLLGYLLTFA
jgi:chromate transporter